MSKLDITNDIGYAIIITILNDFDNEYFKNKFCNWNTKLIHISDNIYTYRFFRKYSSLEQARRGIRILQRRLMVYKPVVKYNKI